MLVVPEKAAPSPSARPHPRQRPLLAQEYSAPVLSAVKDEHDQLAASAEFFPRGGSEVGVGAVSVQVGAEVRHKRVLVQTYHAIA